MLAKRPNVFATAVSNSTNQMAEAIEKSRMAEVRIDVATRQSLAVMEAETVKVLCSFKCMGVMQTNTQAEYSHVVRDIEEHAKVEGLEEQAQQHIEDFKDHLEVRGGQQLLGVLEVGAANIGRCVAQPVMPRKSFWQRLFG